MSDLQIGLVLVGVALIVVVLLFNWWQDRRVRRQMKTHFPQVENDPLMAHETNERKEPSVEVAERLGVLKLDDFPNEEIDPGCEAVVDIQLPQPIEGADLLDALKRHLRFKIKPSRVFVLSEQGQLENYPVAGTSYVGAQIAVLLADREGPLTAVEWSRLWAAAEGIAQEFDGTVDGPEQDKVIEQAEMLDEVCAQLDAQVGLTVHLPHAMSLERVEQAILDVGLMRTEEGYAWLAESGIPRFVVLFEDQNRVDFQDESVRVLNLLLDVPHSPKDTQAFSRIAGVGRDLAARLGGQLTDEQGQSVNPQVDDQLDEQLLTIYERLEAAGFIAGESRTKKVFRGQ